MLMAIAWASATELASVAEKRQAHGGPALIGSIAVRTHRDGWAEQGATTMCQSTVKQQHPAAFLHVTVQLQRRGSATLAGDRGRHGQVTIIQIDGRGGDREALLQVVEARSEPINTSALPLATGLDLSFALGIELQRASKETIHPGHALTAHRPRIQSQAEQAVAPASEAFQLFIKLDGNQRGA